MNATTVAVDLAKDVFELAFSDGRGRITERKRVGRRAFARLLENRVPLRVVMEACGSAHHWARRLQTAGHTVVLLPAHDVRPYVRRNKTDRADAAGLLEADRCGAIRPVPVKTQEQQSVQGMHRVREQHKAMRTASINALRGLLREFGITIPEGAARVCPAVLAATLAVDRDARTVTFTLPATALGRPDSLSGARLHITTWDYDGGYRPITEAGGPHTFAGAPPDAPRVMDTLTLELPN